MSKKPLGTKLRYGKILKQNRRVPQWVMVRTSRRFTSHDKRHNWRRSHLQLR